VAAAGQTARGDVDSAEAVWQLMAELLVGTAKGVTVPPGVAIGAGKSGRAPVRVLQTKDVKGTCKLLTHISAALAARMGEGLDGGGTDGRNGAHGSLEDFNKEARKRRTHMNKLVKLAGKEGNPEDGNESERDAPSGTVRDGADVDLGGASAGLSERGGPLADSGGGERPCDECESRRAAMDCVECEQALCTQCSGRIHSKGARQSHLLTALGPARQCEECEAAAAGVSCTECEQSLCQSCSERIHSKGARARHHIAPLSLSRVEQLVPPGTGSSATFPSASPSRGGVGERSGQRENPSGRGLGKRSGVHIQASSKVCSLLRPLDLGPELVLEQTEFNCPETISGSASEGGSLTGQVERAMYVDVAGQDEGRGGGEERRPCWVVLIKGEAFLQNMIHAQVRGQAQPSSEMPMVDAEIFRHVVAVIAENLEETDSPCQQAKALTCLNASWEFRLTSPKAARAGAPALGGSKFASFLRLLGWRARLDSRIMGQSQKSPRARLTFRPTRKSSLSRAVYMTALFE
jgi:hypothetical protein